MGVLSGLPLERKFGKLRIVKEVEPGQHPNGKMKRLVEVVCDCGQTVVKSLMDVKTGQQKSCGLCRKELPVKDISGKKVYRLTVLDSFTRKDGNVYWDCLCQCGTSVSVDGRQLRDKRVRNCGECGTPMGKYHIGDKGTNKEGYTVEIVKIKSERQITVKVIGSGEEFDIDYSYLKSGSFSNPFHRSVAGIGYFGVGKFIAKFGGKHTVEYADWNSMLKRCYTALESRLSYSNKDVCEEWHNYQNFAEWATNQMNFGKEGWDLEKDLLIKNNKVYSPNTCVYLPREINSFIKRNRVNDLPLGVDVAYKYNGTPYFRVQGREDGKNVNLGSFYNVEEAFSAYKVHKEYLAKKLAEKWKNKIPDVAYKALLNYTVEITD